MKCKCSRCGEMFEDVIIDKLKINKKLAKRVWCRKCIDEMWNNEKQKQRLH